MPYITSERIKLIREEIKKAFPEFKFSITRRHHSTICVHILEGSLNFGTPYQQVNHFWINEHYKGEAREMLLKIYSIMNKGNYTIVEDADYGSVPSFYCDIQIGQWDKPYKLILNSVDGNKVAGIRLKAIR